MSKLRKLLLLVEVTACFSPAAIFLILGLVVSWFVIGDIVSGNINDFLIGLPILMLVLGGVLGMLGLVAMLMRILQGKFAWDWAIVILPLLATIHICWLGHPYLRSSTTSKQSENKN